MSITIDSRLKQQASPANIALIGFANILSQNNSDFLLLSAHPEAGPATGAIGGWVVQIVTGEPPPRQFGRFANCNPAARCVNCERICPVEDGLVELCLRTDCRSIMRVHLWHAANGDTQVWVTTFVAGKPHLSDVWVPMICPRYNCLVLVTSSGSRAAYPVQRGGLWEQKNDRSASARAFDARVFLDQWRRTLDGANGDAEPAYAALKGGL